MLLNSSWELLVSVRNPWMVDSSSSRMSVTAVSTTCAFAPGSSVETEMIGGSMSGSSRTDRRAYPITPNRTSAAESRSEEHTSELQSQSNLVCRLLLEKKKKNSITLSAPHPTQH